MIRLCEAVARVYLSPDILKKHVSEAVQLMKSSIKHVENEDVDLEEEEAEMRQVITFVFIFSKDIDKRNILTLVQLRNSCFFSNFSIFS